MLVYTILVIIIIIILLVVRGYRGIPKPVDSLPIILTDLLRRGYHHGFLIINLPYSKKFLQVRKYINKPGEYGIELAFPNSKWSFDYFLKVEKFCIDQSINYLKLQDGILEFLYIDFKKDIEYASKTIKDLLKILYGVDEGGKILIRLGNGTPKDELIDSISL